MARTSKSGAPAEGGIDNLDTLDIDDMFADDGDALFDGLDLDLEPMGDIADMGNTAEAASSAEPAKEEKSEPVPAPVPAADEPPKRRKTKRKLKATVLAGEEDEEAPTKKKRRTPKPGGTTKKKTSKKEESKAEVVKAKGKTKITAPQPIARAASSAGPSGATMTQGNVAAAGQFGGRQKRGHFALPLSRTKSDSQKTKNKLPMKPPSSAAIVSSASGANLSDKKKNKKTTSSTSISTTTQSAAAAPVPAVPAKPAPYVPHYPQATFCGLTESSGLFYPFMPSLPPEPSLKNRKQYPVIDKIHASFSSYINATTVPKGNSSESAVAETEGIFTLMMETLKELTTSAGQAENVDSKKAAMTNAITSLRKTVVGMEKTKLATDLFSVAALLKRQYDFLNQNLTNMDKWCKKNFTEQEYAITYGLADPQKKQKESPAAESVFANLTKPLIKVKIKCAGFKDPKPSATLFALLPKSVIGGSSSATEPKEKKVTKKRKSSTILDPTTVATSVTAVPAADKEDLWKTYMTQKPGKRRQLVADDVALTAKELEAKCISSTIARCSAIERRHADLKSMVENDEVLVVHTAAMWQYVNKAGYFADFTDESLKDTLRSVWSPELKHNFERDLTRDIQRIVKEKPQGTKSVFDGLTSLLVEEMSADEADSDDEDDSIFDDDNNNNFDEILDPSIRYNTKLVDLSGLTLDERAFTHLRVAGLLGEGVSYSDFSDGRHKLAGIPDAECDSSLEDVIQRMSDDLLRLSSVNNARTSFLESVAGQYNVQKKGKSQRAARESAALAKCQQLLKRRNDNKLKAASKPKVSKDEYALPW